MENSKRKISAFEIVLLALGSPIWLSLLIAVLAVILSLYITLWALVVSFWAIMGALAGAGVSVVIGGLIIALGGNAITGIAAVGAGLISSGLAIFAFFGCCAASKGTVALTKRISYAIKKTLIKEEVAK